MSRKIIVSSLYVIEKENTRLTFGIWDIFIKKLFSCPAGVLLEYVVVVYLSRKYVEESHSYSVASQTSEAVEVI